MSNTALDQNNPEFTQAVHYMEETTDNLFITGEAGTGKSTLLRFFVENTQKNVVVLAPTGLAAINAGGQTIHKFCQFPPRLLTPDAIQEVKIPSQKKLLKSLEVIVIDEVSMVRADIMDGIDLFLRLNRRINEPFGGVQVILLGDLLQLSPIVNREEMEGFSDRYPSPYFFSSQVFSGMEFKYVELLKNYRQQDDQEFLKLLQAVKTGQLNESVLARINSRVLVGAAEAEFEQGLCVNLSTTNLIANELNQRRLHNLAGNEYIFEADMSGQFNERDCPAETVLRLKKGAQIMFIKNDSEGRWVNGTMGVIENGSKYSILVRLENGRVYEIEPVRWESVKFVYSEDQERVVPQVVGWLEQYPLKLAWGVTIHKSQGQTFDRVVIDMGRGSFAHGQTYVALSRCRSLQGIELKRPVEKRDFILDKRVLEFLDGVSWNNSK